MMSDSYVEVENQPVIGLEPRTRTKMVLVNQGVL